MPSSVVFFMHIFFPNLHSLNNAGDTALSTLALQQIRAQFPGCTITLAMTEPESHTGPEPVVASFNTWFRNARTRTTHWQWAGVWVTQALLAVLTYRLMGRTWGWGVSANKRALLQAYFEADLVVTSPGGYLYNTARGLGLLNSLFTLAYALWAGKPLYFLPQSLGPFGYVWQTQLLQAILRRARLVMVREPISWQLLQTLGPLPNSYEIPDLAFLLPKATAAEQATARAWLQSQGLEVTAPRPWLGLTVVDWGGQNPGFNRQAQYETAITEAAQTFLTQFKGTVILFPQVCTPIPGQDDRVASRRLAATLRAWGQHVVTIDEPQTFPILKAAYGCMDLFLGTRMHSNIFAVLEGVPFIAIGYQPKTLGIAQMLGLERWVLDIKDVNGLTLSARLAELWEARVAVREQVARILPELAARAAQTGLLIAQDFQAWQATHRP